MTATLIRDILTDESGATAIEYGLLTSLVSIAAITALTDMGTSVQELFTEVADRLEDVNNKSGG